MTEAVRENLLLTLLSFVFLKCWNCSVFWMQKVIFDCWPQPLHCTYTYTYIYMNYTYMSTSWLFLVSVCFLPPKPEYPSPWRNERLHARQTVRSMDRGIQVRSLGMAQGILADGWLSKMEQMILLLVLSTKDDVWLMIVFDCFWLWLIVI